MNLTRSSVSHFRLEEEYKRQKLISAVDPDLVEGVPIGIQVVCGKYEDEKCIAVAKVIESIISQRQ